MQRLLVINSRYHVDCGPLETLTAGNTPRTTRTALFVNKARRSRFSFRGFYSVGRNLLSILQTVIIYAEFKSLEPLEQLVSYRKKKKKISIQSNHRLLSSARPSRTLSMNHGPTTMVHAFLETRTKWIV